jgi:hypothetical protein
MNTTRPNWQIPPEAFEQVPQAMAEIALDECRSERLRIGAARVLVSMFAQNEPAPLVTVELNSTAETVQALMREPDYLHYLEARGR